MEAKRKSSRKRDGIMTHSDRPDPKGATRAMRRRERDWLKEFHESLNGCDVVTAWLSEFNLMNRGDVDWRVRNKARRNMERVLPHEPREIQDAVSFRLEYSLSGARARALEKTLEWIAMPERLRSRFPPLELSDLEAWRR